VSTAADDADADAEAPPAEGGALADLTAFQRDVCWILEHEGPSYGLAIKRSLEHYYGESIYHGRLYPNLDDLVDDGLVDKCARDKRTNEYALTERGRRALQARLRWVEVGGEHS
jgi:DNA-binding PadR family transcriptional regulator